MQFDLKSVYFYFKLKLKMILTVVISDEWCTKYLVAWATTDAEAIKKVQDDWCEYNDLYVDYHYSVDNLDWVIFTHSWA